MPNLLRNQSVIFFAIVYEISKSVIPLSNSVSKNLVIGFETYRNINENLVSKFVVGSDEVAYKLLYT